MNLKRNAGKKVAALIFAVALGGSMSACSSPEAKVKENIAEEGISGIEPPTGCEVIDNIDEFEEVTGNQSYNRDTDADRNFNKLTTGVTDAEDILYAFSDNWIIYCDKKTGNSGLLCGKPDCDHMNEKCNSYIKNSWGIQYYSGYLYTVQNDDDGFKLIKISTDGSEREDLGKMTDVDVVINGGCSLDWIIHRGYIYYVYVLAARTDDVYYLNNSNCIYRKSLERGSKPECIMPLPLQSSFEECRFIGTGSYVYILKPTADKETGCYLYRYNIEAEKLEWFKEWGNNICGVAVHNSNIYYLEKYADEKKLKMYCYNPETKEKYIFFETNGISAGMFYDDDYIYIADTLDDETWKREVWSWDGSYLADIEFNPTGYFDNEGKFRGLAGSDDERIYISCIGENIYNIPIMGIPVVIEYIEKKDIQDGVFELKEWVKIGAED